MEYKERVIVNTLDSRFRPASIVVVRVVDGAKQRQPHTFKPSDSPVWVQRQKLKCRKGNSGQA